MNAATGKYVAFVDNDDILWPADALKFLYEVAENSKADVVHCSGHYEFTDSGETAVHPVKYEVPFDNISAPTPLSQDLGERLQLFCHRHIGWNIWNKLFRRQMLSENKIRFIDKGDDLSFCFQCLCYAKNYIRVPEHLYVYRSFSSTSVTLKQSKAALAKRFSREFDMMKGLDDFMLRFPFFEDHPHMRQQVLDFWMITFILSPLINGNWSYDHTGKYRDELETALANVWGDSASMPLSSLMRILFANVRN